ncbi:hypothetical protein RSOL_137070 [Rhizoctonia solani AG-3 Rhs1AP]|uniref:Uncharacterized protein n=1 Tax=Rhizoctonia solani AG-3 Rhs1AP TaxID=1086054 RepID=X8J3F1_9AGAM|nr:hypothetical protein RSOL_137070 [Rhizoctonia solani AG-3 Rhs1AP]
MRDKPYSQVLGSSN